MMQGLQGLGFPVLLSGCLLTNFVVRIGRELLGRIRRVCEMTFGVSFFSFSLFECVLVETWG